MQDIDKAARYSVKQHPHGYCRWLCGPNTSLLFHAWLDARRLALPSEGDLTCDLVAGLRPAEAPGPTCALIVELMAESRPAVVDRLLAYVVRLWGEPPPGVEPGTPLPVGGAVVNLTGPAQPDRVTLALPGVPECELHFRIVQRTLRDIDAAATLADIAAGRTTRWLLPWIPLMHGGVEAAIMEQWQEVARAEPDPQVRATLAGLAVVFADLAGRAVVWKQALEGWNVRNSQVIDEWRNEGRVEGRQEGRLESHREDLLALLQERFGAVPEEWVQRIQALTDVDRLKAAIRQVVHIHTLEELQL
jgi:hypothetical protein